MEKGREMRRDLNIEAAADELYFLDMKYTNVERKGEDTTMKSNEVNDCVLRMEQLKIAKESGISADEALDNHNFDSYNNHRKNSLYIYLMTT